jgi:predicted nucleic acid-binding protein
MTLCLDTYALVEMHDRNSNYTHIFDNDWVVTELTLAEFYSVLLRKHNRKTAAFWCAKFMPFAVKIPLNTLLQAMHMKVECAKQNLSFFDCVGYIYAREHKMQFVTGDKEFKGKEGVLFIK